MKNRNSCVQIVLAALCISCLFLSGCGRQKFPDLPKATSGQILDINQASFDQEVLKSERPVVVLFYNPKYSESNNMLTRVQHFAGKYGGDIKFATYLWNMSDDPSLFSLRQLPTTLLYKSGREIDRINGIPQDAEQLSKWNEDLELWILKTVFDIKGDQYSGEYKYRFNDSSTLQMSGY